MKKILLFSVASLFSALVMAAGVNTNTVITNNNNKEQASSSEKEGSKYSFTLFNFFSGGSEKVKTDSVKTETRLPVETEKKETN